jgi:hypothetical protein
MCWAAGRGCVVKKNPMSCSKNTTTVVPRRLNSKKSCSASFQCYSAEGLASVGPNKTANSVSTLIKHIDIHITTLLQT